MKKESRKIQGVTTRGGTPHTSGGGLRRTITETETVLTEC